jgi:hypothetical protein
LGQFQLQQKLLLAVVMVEVEDLHQVKLQEGTESKSFLFGFFNEESLTFPHFL